MGKIVVGIVTDTEKNEIFSLFKRKKSLNELIKSIQIDSTELYEKIVSDLGDTNVKYDSWWQRMSVKYNWPSIENGSWRINFDTNEIYLVTE